MLRKILISTFVILICFGSFGCGVSPYTADVQQGNVFDQSTINQLTLGMTKSDVQNILGTPLLNGSVAEDNWTYVYTNQKNGGKITEKHLHLKFHNNRLVEIK